MRYPDDMNALVGVIADMQNADGGWGFLQGRTSNTECTSLCLLALESLKSARAEASVGRAVEWLVRRQHADGSWPLSDSSTHGSWTTALAIIALSRFPQYYEKTVSATHWLLKQEGRTPGLLARLISVFFSRTASVELDPTLVGWSWHPKTFSWVEPTSYALIALKKVRSSLSRTDMIERIRQGELMIYDRKCEGGGWNYGNSKVLGETLWPYPDVTAVALIALQDRRSNEANQESLQALQKMMRQTPSGLALAWGSICLSIYDENTAEWQRQIMTQFQATEFLGEVKTVALALLALSSDMRAFRI
jgi:hypothetical protein